MSLIERLKHWAQETPDASAITFESQTISFAELQKRVHQTAAFLRNEHGVETGDRVACLSINDPKILYLVFACAQLGAIFAPFNSRLARGEYEFLLGDAEPKVFFHDSNFSQIVSGIDHSNCVFVNLDVLHHQDDPDVSFEPSTVAESDPLLLVYTSGTTGRPKGVLLSHFAIAANIENNQALYDFAPGQNVLITLPLFHVGGLCILLLPALTHGATIFLHARFDPEATIASLVNDDIITSIFVPAQMSALMSHREWATSKFATMKYVVVGSSIIPLAQIKEWHARNIPVSQVYGATETGPTAIALSVDEAMAREGSAGKVAKLCAIEIRDRDGVQLPMGEDGEIWVKGPNILSAYWRNPSETDLVLRDGWYNTGDVGRCDEDGFYWIIDRTKDVIISGGENIYPAEIESVGLEHPAIAAIAVVGKPDPVWGETPVAVIELESEQSLDQSEFLSFLKEKIAKFKQPKELVILDALPRNGMGKIEKSAIRKMFR